MESLSSEQGTQRPLPIGWKERVALPDWGIRRVRAKVDTGARTSALDVAGYELVPIEGRGLVCRMRLRLNRGLKARLIEVEAPVLRLVGVTSSSGIRQQRPVVETRIRLGTVCKRIRLTLTDRGGMRFRMLLGREALAGDFVVDASKTYLVQ